MPGSQVLIAIARALGVSEDYLLSEQELSLDGVEPLIEGDKPTAGGLTSIGTTGPCTSEKPKTAIPS